MLYMDGDGTDHIAYAHLADWLNAHPITNPPLTDPARPYMSEPIYLLQTVPQFGSFAFLGLVSLATGKSGTFSYDPGVALVTVAGVLAVAAVFCAQPAHLGPIGSRPFHQPLV